MVNVTKAPKAVKQSAKALGRRTAKVVDESILADSGGYFEHTNAKVAEQFSYLTQPGSSMGASDAVGGDLGVSEFLEQMKLAGGGMDEADDFMADQWGAAYDAGMLDEHLTLTGKVGDDGVLVIDRDSVDVETLQFARAYDPNLRLPVALDLGEQVTQTTMLPAHFRFSDEASDAQHRMFSLPQNADNPRYVAPQVAKPKGLSSFHMASYYDAPLLDDPKRLETFLDNVMGKQDELGEYQVWVTGEEAIEKDLRQSIQYIQDRGYFDGATPASRAKALAGDASATSKIPREAMSAVATNAQDLRTDAKLLTSYYDQFSDANMPVDHNSIYVVGRFNGNPKDKRPMLFTHGDSEFIQAPGGSKYIQSEQPIEIGSHFSAFGLAKPHFTQTGQIAQASEGTEFAVDVWKKTIKPEHWDEFAQRIEDAVLDYTLTKPEQKGVLLEKEGKRAASKRMFDEVVEAMGGDDIFRADEATLGTSGVTSPRTRAKERMWNVVDRVDTALSSAWFDVQSPILLFDSGSFSPAAVAAQLVDMPTFRKYNDILHEIGRLGTNQESVEYLQATRAVQKILEDEGFDHIIYINRKENAGTPSFVVWDESKIHTVKRKTYRSVEFEASSMRNQVGAVMGMLGITAGIVAPTQEAEASLPGGESRAEEVGQIPYVQDHKEWDTISPKLVDPLLLVIKDMNKYLDEAYPGFKLGIRDISRSVEDQKALYEIGRRGIAGEKPVTWTMNSRHIASEGVPSTAADVQFRNADGVEEYPDGQDKASDEIWQLLGKIVVKHGLKWGGDFDDGHHIQTIER